MFTVCFIWRKDKQKISKINNEIILYPVSIEEIKSKVESNSIISVFGVNRAGIESESAKSLVNTVLISVMAYLHTIYFQHEKNTEVVI